MIQGSLTSHLKLSTYSEASLQSPGNKALALLPELSSTWEFSAERERGPPGPTPHSLRCGPLPAGSAEGTSIFHLPSHRLQ